MSFENPPIVDPCLSASDLQRILSLQGEILRQAVVRTDYTELMNELCLLAESFTPNAAAAIILYDKDRDAIFVEAGPSLSADARLVFNGLRSGIGSCGNTVYHKEPMYVCNTLEDVRWKGHADVAMRLNICSCFSFPILDGDGNAIGSFSISSFEPRTPDGFHRALLETCTSICGGNAEAVSAGRYKENSLRTVSLTRRRLRENVLDHIAGNISQSSLNTIVIVSQSFMVQPQ